MIKYQGVIFNLDNTIINPLDILVDSFKFLLKSQKISIPANCEKNLINMNFLEICDYIKTFYIIENDFQNSLNEFKNLIYKKFAQDVKIKVGLLDYLIFLKENSIKIGLITTYEEKLYKPYLINNKIYDFFDNILYIGSIQNENIYKPCLDSLNLNYNNVIIFENCIKNIVLAKNNNLKVFLLYDNIKYTPNVISNLENYIDEYITDFRELIV